MIFDVAFKTFKDRIRFQSKYKIKREQILLDHQTRCWSFAWAYLRDARLNPIYYMSDMGYTEPKEILKECLKSKIRISFMAWIPINDKQATWEKIRGRW